MPPPLEQVLMNQYKLRYREAQDIVQSARQDLGLPPAPTRTCSGLVPPELRAECHKRCLQSSNNSLATGGGNTLSHEQVLPPFAQTIVSCGLPDSTNTTVGQDATTATGERTQKLPSTTNKLVTESLPSVDLPSDPVTTTKATWTMILYPTPADSTDAKTVLASSSIAIPASPVRPLSSRQQLVLPQQRAPSLYLSPTTSHSSPGRKQVPRPVNQCRLQLAKRMDTPTNLEDSLTDFRSYSSECLDAMVFPNSLSMTPEQRMKQGLNDDTALIQRHSFSGGYGGLSSLSLATPSSPSSLLLKRDEEPLFPGSQRQISPRSILRSKVTESGVVGSCPCVSVGAVDDEDCTVTGSISSASSSYGSFSEFAT